MTFLHNRLARTTALIVAAGFVAHAAADGAITFVVTDKSGKPIQGALVAASSPTQIGGQRRLTTDANGKVRFSNLSPGMFRLEISATGFQPVIIPSIAVQVDQVSAASAKMVPASEAVVEVISSVASVDVTSVTTGAHMGQEELQALPLGRSQLSALTMVPGVISVGGNPSLAAGLNRNQQGATGARNNTYLLDGVDVTNPATGTLRTTIAQELIQDQDIKTGGITAEYSARAGLFTNAVTINGSNELSGGLSIYNQYARFSSNVGKDRPLLSGRHAEEQSGWVSGPILKDKLWYVVSASKLKDTSGVTLNAAAGGGSYRTINNDETRVFGKLTWQIAPEHMLQGIFSRNPSEFDNGGPTVLQNRLFLSKRGGDRYSLNYTWAQPSMIFEVKVARHEEKDSAKAFSSAAGPQVTVRSSSALTPKQQQLGNSSADTERIYRKDQVRFDFTKFFDLAGSHVFKTGYGQGQDEQATTIGVNGGASYENFDAIYTYNQVTTLPVSGAVNGAFTKVLGVINNNATYAGVKTFLDTDSSGTVSSAELSAYSFSEADPAHPGTYYGYRLNQVSKAPSSPKLKTKGLYVQDQWQVGRWNLTLGLRGDDYTFLADTGLELWRSKFSDNLAPRLGVSWDMNGDGRTKLFGFWGRYVDPMKLDMVSFSGSLISSVRNEDIRINNTWVTENVRGGLAVRDAGILDNLKNPKTDELRLGFSKDFGKYSLDVAGTYRHDFDLVEDWDPATYADADSLEAEARQTMGIGGTVGVYSGAGSATLATYGSASLTASGKAVIDYWRSLVLPTSFWAGGGMTGAQALAAYSAGEVNFFLGTLPGGYRNFRSLDVTVTRKMENKWGGFVSGTLVNATGNSLSSGNADFQGDLARFDPRLPFANGALEGSPDWLAKANVYYKWDSGVMVSMTYQTNSGYHYSDAFLASGRALQATPKITSTNTTGFWAEQLGKNRTPVVRQMDLRVQYGRSIWKKVKGEVYLDIFNLFNTQQPTDIAEGTNVRSGYQTGQAYAYQAPLNTRFGFRLKF